MSLTHKTFPQVVLTQVKWKVMAYSQALITLLILQIVMYYFNYSGSGMSTRGNGLLSLQTHFYSLDGFVISTCLWSFVTAYLIQTKDYRKTNLSIVSNRVTGNIANALVLVFYSFIATIIVHMSLYILVAFIQLVKGITMFPDVSLFNFLHFLVSFCLILLAASSGYFLSSLFNLSKILGGLFVIFFGLFLFRVFDEQLLTIMRFYFEAGYLLFIVKALITASLFFTLPVVFLNRKEVVRG
ncbi:hypothetical protein LG296_00750 [Ureibacillus chungkukjangi]|uniref:ABC-2 family transporter n=1 Tax=Ureibacillus chungkukjangi TaxID=1202712 RepID=A0A318U355_9BACL|nr:hypothetical protein [Ureibacillus chungkukjangi]MCM3390137.1 hypothetical protein [Ureibacillus chungkukjangi]PYF06329.1 hypothetical protein BJ095_11031 [Ureibacillus chungkukjangi]